MNREFLARPGHTAIATLALIGASACAGDPASNPNAEVAQGGSDPSGMLGGGSAGMSASAGTSASGSGGGGAAAFAIEDSPPSAAPLRRLTHIEYNNTVADLLGDTTSPALQFAPDVAQDGFTNNALGQTVSPALAEQYMLAAEALSSAASANLNSLMGCDPTGAAEQTCVSQFIQSFGQRAWRRPVRADEQARLLAVYNAGRAEFAIDQAVKMVVQVLLQSPQFIYLLEQSDPALGAPVPNSVVPLDSWQLASRLSYFLTGSMPDPILFAEAERGALTTPEQIAAQAERLLTTARARERVALFFTEWMELRNIDRMQKDATLFPNYSLQLGAQLREQVQYFATSIVFDQPGTLMDLLTAPATFMSPELAPLYGVAAPASAGFSGMQLDPTQRAGLLTHVGILANLAKANQNDPVHRGKFVRERLLCDTVPPPPANANITPPAISADATTRERFTQHRADPSCAGCHTLMDPIGLGFEHYDALGQWRDTENGLPIDATGEIVGSDVAGPFNGAIELAQKLAASSQVQACLVETMFRFAHGRSVTADDSARLSWLGGQFAGGAYQVRRLLVALTQSQAFRYQLLPDPNFVPPGPVAQDPTQEAP